MPVRRLLHIFALLALPVLWGCGQSEPQVTPPPSSASLAAITDEGGAPREQLGQTIDALFDEEAAGKTHALIVMKRGSVIVERYGEGIKAETRLPGRGIDQCVTALMAGQLVSDGRLRLNESAPVPDWQRPGDPRGVITLKQLLQMRSGLRNAENASPAQGIGAQETDRFRMLYLDGRDDMAAYAESQPLVAPAGRDFANSSATSVILADLAARVLSPDFDPGRRRRAVGDYLHNRVLAPIGMDSTKVGYDRAGTMIGAEMVSADARDWARLGEFLRRNGSVRGAQILPRRWIQFMLTPSPRERGYGAGVWLNRAGPGANSRLYPGTAPTDLFACLGAQGQYVIGSPGQLLTIVRLGASNDAQASVVHDRLGKLISLFPGFRR